MCSRTRTQFQLIAHQFCRGMVAFGLWSWKWFQLLLCLWLVTALQYFIFTASSSGQFPGFHTSVSTTSLDPSDPGASGGQPFGLRRCSSGTSLAGSSAAISIPFNNIYSAIWRALLLLASDPHPEIQKLAKEVVGYVKEKVRHYAVPLHFKTTFLPFLLSSKLYNYLFA